MQFIRWYDKNPDTKKLMSFLESLDELSRSQVAQDFLQILMSEARIDLTNKLNELMADKSVKYRRWYDHDLDLYSCVEILKMLDDTQKKQVILSLTESVLQMMVQEND